MTHLTFDEISDLAERPNGAAAEHLATCDACRATLRQVHVLLDAAHALPRAADPPRDAWAGILDRVRRERPGRAWPARAWPARAWMRPLISAAAALLFVAGAIAALTLHDRAAKAREPFTAATSRTSVPALQAVDRNYAPTIRVLRAALTDERAQLAPGTLRTVERALSVIDSAIAEARSALAADPANGALVDILSTHYEHKVDLLQRAAALSSL